MTRIHLGTYTLRPPWDEEAVIEFTDTRPPVFNHHDLVMAYVERHASGRLSHRREKQFRAELPSANMLEHLFLSGPTGGGKTGGLENLALQALAAGFSLFFICGKGEAIDRLAPHLLSSGLSSEQLVLIDPRRLDAVPGWNPILTGVSTNQVTDDLIAGMRAVSDVWGPRLDHLLTCFISLAAHLRLSLFEVLRMIQQDDYRCAMLKQVESSQSTDFDLLETHAALKYGYGSWSKSEQRTAAAPAESRLRALLHSPYVRSMLCANRDTVRIADCWSQPRVILAQLDGPTLGSANARLLAGLLVNQVLQCAFRASGRTPVLLVIDELRAVEAMVGSSLTTLVTMGRSKNLAVAAATQHITSISDSLRETLMGNVANHLCFGAGDADARYIARVASSRVDPAITRATIAIEPADRSSGVTPVEEWILPILDPYGQVLEACPQRWRDLACTPAFSTTPVAALYSLCRSSGLNRLYVRSPRTDEPVELLEYCCTLPKTSVQIRGPRPIQLTVQIPRCRSIRTERIGESEAASFWQRELPRVRRQHALLISRYCPIGVIRVPDIPQYQITPEVLAYQTAAHRANSQSAAEIKVTMQSRQQAIGRTAGGQEHGTKEEDEDDGSIF